MKIIVNKKSKPIQEIEERLISNSLAYKILIDLKVNKPKLIDGSSEIKGIKEINAYLDSFEQEKQQWHYCDC